MKAICLGAITMTLTLILLVSLVPSAHPAMMRYEFAGTFTDGSAELSIQNPTECDELSLDTKAEWDFMGKEFHGYFEYDPVTYNPEAYACYYLDADYLIGGPEAEIEGSDSDGFGVCPDVSVDGSSLTCRGLDYGQVVQLFGILTLDLAQSVNDPRTHIGENLIVGGTYSWSGESISQVFQGICVDGSTAYYAAKWGFSGAVTSWNVVPEPATVLLLGTGLVGLMGFRKKFKK